MSCEDIELALLELNPKEGLVFASEKDECPELPTLFSHGSCEVCGRDDWIPDVQRGDLICRGCGLCQDRIRLGGDSFRQNQARNDGGDHRNLVETAMDFAYPNPNLRPDRMPTLSTKKRSLGSSRSAPYKRITYFRERLSQWQQTEPGIPESDWSRIVDSYLFWAKSQRLEPYVPTVEQLKSASGRIPGTILLEKEEIRAILVDADTRPRPFYTYTALNHATGEVVTCSKEENHDDPEAANYVKVGHYVKKYFEKWLTIRYRLSGVKSMASTVPSWIGEEMCITFQSLQKAFWHTIYDKSDRTSMPSYNYIICRLLDLLGLSRACVDFPELKTETKKRKLREYWRRICLYMRWPYINSDEMAKKSTKKVKLM